MIPKPGVTQALARFVVDTRWEDIPEQARHEAKRALLNFFAVAIAGCRTEPVELALKTLAEFSGGRQATIVGRSERIDALSAAFLNGAGANRYGDAVQMRDDRANFVDALDLGASGELAQRGVRQIDDRTVNELEPATKDAAEPAAVGRFGAGLEDDNDA